MKPGKIDVDVKMHQTFQDELLGVMIKSMFNDTLNKPWYTGVRAL